MDHSGGNGATERQYHGLGVSRGIAIGTIHWHDGEALTVPEYRIAAARTGLEVARLNAAVDISECQLGEMQAKVKGLHDAAGEEVGFLLEAYRQILHGSRLIRGVVRRIEHDRINAEAALSREIDAISQTFEAMEDAYLAARALDIRDMGRRLLRNLTRPGEKPFQHLPHHTILCADELTPSDTALLDPKTTLAFVTSVGGAESHTAIVARSLGIPAVLGVVGLTGQIEPGTTAIVDGTKGIVIVNPQPETMTRYRAARADHLRARRALARLRDLPAVTRDGVRIQLQANVELPTEISAVLAAGAEGIGLLRTEFQFMNRPDLPSEEEQFATLHNLLGRLEGRTLTVRTLDVGGDKLARSLSIHPGPNPALGLRAVRLCLARPDLLRAQLSAILRASAFGRLRILIPMIATVDELLAVRAIAHEVAEDLTRRQIPFALPLPPIGIMIEVPGAALNADALALRADFFSIGTNDLTQYTLAIDRADEAVANLYDPLHPAVLRLIQFAAQAAFRAKIPVGICGEMAGDPRYTPLLLGLGIRDLSMSATNIAVVKRRIRELDMSAAHKRATIIMNQYDSKTIATLLDDFNRAKR